MCEVFRVCVYVFVWVCACVNMSVFSVCAHVCEHVCLDVLSVCVLLNLIVFDLCL